MAWGRGQMWVCGPCLARAAHHFPGQCFTWSSDLVARVCLFRLRSGEVHQSSGNNDQFQIVLNIFNLCCSMELFLFTSVYLSSLPNVFTASPGDYLLFRRPSASLAPLTRPIGAVPTPSARGVYVWPTVCFGLLDRSVGSVGLKAWFFGIDIFEMDHGFYLAPTPMPNVDLYDDQQKNTQLSKRSFIDIRHFVIFLFYPDVLIQTCARPIGMAMCSVDQPMWNNWTPSCQHRSLRPWRPYGERRWSWRKFISHRWLKQLEKKLKRFMWRFTSKQ